MSATEREGLLETNNAVRADATALIEEEKTDDNKNKLINTQYSSTSKVEIGDKTATTLADDKDM